MLRPLEQSGDSPFATCIWDQGSVGPTFQAQGPKSWRAWVTSPRENFSVVAGQRSVSLKIFVEQKRKMPDKKISFCFSRIQVFSNSMENSQNTSLCENRQSVAQNRRPMNFVSLPDSLSDEKLSSRKMPRQYFG